MGRARINEATWAHGCEERFSAAARATGSSSRSPAERSAGSTSVSSVRVRRGNGAGENNHIRPCWGDAITAVISGQAASTKGGESCELRAWKGKGNTPKCQKLGGASALCSTIWAF